MPLPPRIPAARTLAALALALLGGAAQAQTALFPANPQPAEDALKPGLAVWYAYPPEVRGLRDVTYWLEDGKEAGPPLVGFDYMDSEPGAPILTAKRAEMVAAEIKGYLRFDAPGTWALEVHSNDGIEFGLGGQTVDSYGTRRACDTNGWVQVSVPRAGWYKVDTLFFQRLNTACLMMRWRKPDGTEEWTPTDAWAYTD
ncbi:hypothetical protein ACQ5SO_06900 [Rhodovulum sp. DZ06]|uniref:hypothetical protein n=1 Tax=Rhodovulum sp. DZ06 TaxID=3425126 RepID=UPI003D33C4D5